MKDQFSRVRVISTEEVSMGRLKFDAFSQEKRSFNHFGHRITEYCANANLFTLFLDEKTMTLHEVDLSPSGIIKIGEVDIFENVFIDKDKKCFISE